MKKFHAKVQHNNSFTFKPRGHCCYANRLQAKAQARLKVAQEVEEEAARKAGWISVGG